MIRTPEGVLRGGVGGRAEAAAGAERKEFSKMGRDFFFFFGEGRVPQVLGIFPLTVPQRGGRTSLGHSYVVAQQGGTPSSGLTEIFYPCLSGPEITEAPQGRAGRPPRITGPRLCIRPSALPREDSKNPGQRRRARIPEPHCPRFRSTRSFPSCVTQGRFLNLSVP